MASVGRFSEFPFHPDPVSDEGQKSQGSGGSGGYDKQAVPAPQPQRVPPVHNFLRWL